MKRRIYKILSLAFLLSFICQGNVAFAQTIMPLPAHASTYSGNSRGLWFTAPTNFTITGIRSPTEIGTGAQTIHLVKFQSAPPAYSSTTTAFTTLFYQSGIAGSNFVSMNITVSTGDIIGVMAVRNNGSGGSQTSYSSTGSPFTSTIAGVSVLLYRVGWQGNIINSPAANFWTEASSAIGRVEIQYSTSQPTDAGLTTYVFPTDTICSGNDSVSVRLKNFGPNSLATVDVNWKVNNVNQTTYNWSGTLASGDSTDINIGAYNFLGDSTYNIFAYTSTPNNVADTVNTNDTINMTSIYVNASPLANVTPSGAINICQNDSLLLTANTDSGLTYQWFKNGIAILGETDTSLTVKQAGSYMVNITNTIGCSTISDTAIVTLLQSPSANANALGPTTFCYGDSVFITANIGSGLTYQWKKDGILIPGATSSTLFANESGAYTVTTTNLNSCSTTSLPINVTVMLPPLDLGPDSTICETHQITLDAGAGMDSYLWSTGDTTQTIIVDSTGIGIGNKNFSVIVTQQGCVNSDTIKVTVMDCSGISENIKLLGINIYPNPSQGKINIDIPEGLDGLEITVFNSIGQKILSELITTKSKIIKTIDLSELPKGVYYIGLKSKEKQKFVKVILN